MAVGRALGIRIVLLVLVALLALGWGWLRWRRSAPRGSGIPDRSASEPLNQPGGGPAPEDAYEVYAALYNEPAQETLAFAEDSVTDIPQMGGSCLKPSTEEERELVKAFEAANAQSHQWEKKFAIAAGYSVLTRSQAENAQECIKSRFQDQQGCAAYRALRHVRYLGVPGFDSTHTHALVSIVRMCGGDCGSGGIFEVEKTGGTWKRADATEFTSNCSWMY